MDELDTARPDDPDPGPALLGDVVLCPAVAVRQARAAGHSMDDELVLLATHGVLHLLGYDHMEPDEEKEMFGLQQKLIEGWRSAPREPVTGARRAGSPAPDELRRDHPAGGRRSCLVPLAGLFAAMDAALQRVSKARVEEMRREGVKRAGALEEVVLERARHVALLLLLRIVCEMVAAVLVTVLFYDLWGSSWQTVLTAAGVMIVVSYVLVGVGPRTLGRQHAYGVALATRRRGAAARPRARARSRRC